MFILFSQDSYSFEYTTIYPFTGWREGRLEGILAGQQEGLELAKKIFKLSAAGMSSEDISKQCGIPVGRVKELLD